MIGDTQGGDGELEGHRKPLDDDLADRPGEADRLSEVTADHVAEIDAELDDDRLVEAVGLVESLACLRRRPLAEDGGARLAGEQPDQQEHEEQDPDQDGYRDQDATEDVSDHFLVRSVERGEAPVRLPPSPL